MFDYKSVLLQDIIEQAYKNGSELEPQKQLASLDADISSFELIEMLCTFINSMAKVSRKQDVLVLCRLKQQSQALMEQNKHLEKHQATLLRENLSLQKKYTYIKSAHSDLEQENQKLKRIVADKEQQLQVCRQALATRACS